MADVLRRIVRDKAALVARRAERTPLAALSGQVEAAAPVRGFADQLLQVADSGRLPVIAEIKKASPSKGVLRAEFNPAEIAAAYENAGAACLSVLTDTPYFQGSDDDLLAARAACSLPVLRKDFMIDPWQIYESRVLGADCVLLIVAALGDASLFEMCELAQELGMDVLVEVHDEQELDRALQTSARLIGVNNRNLSTFATDIATTVNLAPRITAPRVLVSESGINEHVQIQRLTAAGARAFLVGEAFMRAPDPGQALTALFGN